MIKEKICRIKGNFIGIDIGGTNIRYGIVSEDKNIISVIEERITNRFSEKDILTQIKSAIDRNFSNKIRGIGIGVPALVDLKKGVFYEAPNLPGISSVNIKKILEKKYKVPVLVNNDANCFALAEKYFGSAKKYKNLAGVILGTGFGAGLIINNKLYCGNNCAAGEFGRIILKDKTIEDYCSGKFFIDKYHKRGEDIYALALEKDKKAINIFNEFGKNLGLGISIIADSLDPEIIVLGGSVIKAYRFFKKPLFILLKKYSYKHVYKNIKIMPSKLKNAGVLGAAALFFEKDIP